MSDLIKREDAIATIGVMYERCDTYDITDYRDLMLEAVKVLPSADRPQGEWIIEKTLYDNYNYRCSYCDWYECHAYPDVEPYNYCPNCGAKMKGADDETD